MANLSKFIVRGGKRLTGEVTIPGAKNVALKIFIASLLTDDQIVLHNVPLIRDVRALLDILESLGVHNTINDHTITIKAGSHINTTVPLDLGGRLRTSSMVLGPMLARFGAATVPNPGGCRIGTRPIDRHIEGLRQMGANITYKSDDGYFYATAPKLHGTNFRFSKNTHTGTETLLLAAVLAEGQTVIENAAEEIEVDDLIAFLNDMGAKVRREHPRRIVIDGVKKLTGGEHTIMPDRNEEVTWAIAAALTDGNVTVRNSQRESITAFLECFEKAGGGMEPLNENTTRYFKAREITPVDIVTGPHPGFMTDWQAPWTVLMTQAVGTSTVHETVFESRFSYVKELRKMGAKIDFFDPKVENPEGFYNFNWADKADDSHQGIRVTGQTPLHDAVLRIDDIRAGASLVLAALIAKGESYIHGVELIDRGYEAIETRLVGIGADIRRVREDE